MCTEIRGTTRWKTFYPRISPAKGVLVKHDPLENFRKYPGYSYHRTDATRRNVAWFGYRAKEKKGMVFLKSLNACQIDY